MKIADGIEMLKLPMNIMGMERIIYPTLIFDNDTVILVDAGVTNSLPEIKRAMEDTGRHLIDSIKLLLHIKTLIILEA